MKRKLREFVTSRPTLNVYIAKGKFLKGKKGNIKRRNLGTSGKKTNRMSKNIFILLLYFLSVIVETKILHCLMWF